MERALALSAILLSITAATASSQVNLAWDDCVVTTENRNRDFTCDYNAREPRLLVASFRPSSPILFCASTTWLRVIVDSGTLPDWWRLEVGACRHGSFQLTGTANLGCEDPYDQLTAGAFLVTNGGTNSTQIEADWINSRNVELEAGHLYVANAFQIDVRKTVDDGSGSTVCSGCDRPAYIEVEKIRAYAQLGGYVDFTATDERRYVTWQGGGNAVPGEVPVQRVTWGGIKRLYR